MSSWEGLLKGKPLTIDRHIDSLINCESTFEDLSLLLNSSDYDLGIVLNLCEQLSFQLEALIGVIPPEDLLDSIFLVIFASENDNCHAL